MHSLKGTNINVDAQMEIVLQHSCNYISSITTNGCQIAHNEDVNCSKQIMSVGSMDVDIMESICIISNNCVLYKTREIYCEPLWYECQWIGCLQLNISEFCTSGFYSFKLAL